MYTYIYPKQDGPPGPRRRRYNVFSFGTVPGEPETSVRGVSPAFRPFFFSLFARDIIPPPPPPDFTAAAGYRFCDSELISHAPAAAAAAPPLLLLLLCPTWPPPAQSRISIPNRRRSSCRLRRRRPHAPTPRDARAYISMYTTRN